MQQDEGRGLPGDVGTAGPHGHADVRRLERRRVVHAVTRHRDDLTVRLERLDEPQLVLRHDARKHVDAGHALAQARESHRSDVGAVRHIPRVGDPGLARDGACRTRMIAGDHHRPDPRAIALGDGVRDRRAHRVGETDQSDEPKGQRSLRLGPRVRSIGVDACSPGCGNPQHAQSVAAHRVERAVHRPALVVVQRTEIGDRLRRSLRCHDDIASVGAFPDARDRKLRRRQRIAFHEPLSFGRRRQ